MFLLNIFLFSSFKGWLFTLKCEQPTLLGIYFVAFFNKK